MYIYFLKTNLITERLNKMNNIDIQRDAIIEIVGTQYDGRARNHTNLKLQQKLVMKHQKNNSHDDNAVLILTNDGKELGFMPKGYASIYAPAIDSNKYNFTVEVVKTESDPERPILIVKIVTEFNNKSEEEIENSLIQFVKNIVNGYFQHRAEYFEFISSETVNVEELISTLNRTRLVYKLYSLSTSVIEKFNIGQATSDFTPFTKVSLLCQIKELQADINEALKKIQKSYNDSFDIDDEEEYHRVQCELRERRKKFRLFDELCTSYSKAVEDHVLINYKTVVPEKPMPEKVIEISEQEQSDTESEQTAAENQQITAKNFFDWLVSDGEASETTARQYISNIHSIEKLYQTLFGVRKKLIEADPDENAKVMIETLIQRSEYVDANERRHNSFNMALSKYAQFAKISIDSIKIQSERKNIQTPISFAESKVDVEIIKNDKISVLEGKTKNADIINSVSEKPQIQELDSFKPDITIPFVLKNAVIAILSSNAPEIYKRREYNNGMSSKVLQELIKEYYEKDVVIFDISRLLILDDTFKFVGKGCYALNMDVFSKNENISEKEAAAKKNKDEYTTNAALVDKITDLINQNKDNLQYEDGFGVYEVKTLLANQGIVNVTEDDIETLMSECKYLREIEEGYYVYSDDINTPVDADEKQNSAARTEFLTETVDISPLDNASAETAPSETRRIVLKLNGNMVRSHDYPDALCKICEFAINCKPFRMARIAGQDICLNGSRVFYRKAVPVDGYNRLSNGLQVMKIDNVSDLKTITDEVEKYCQIEDDMIMVISK